MKLKNLFLILLLLFLFYPIFSFCGDNICEINELNKCRDCAFIRKNYRCDPVENISLYAFDPDCKTGLCYDDFYLYSHGKGPSCYPYKCNSGCLSSCTSYDQCATMLCISNSCSYNCIRVGSASEEENCCGILDNECKNSTNSNLKVIAKNSAFYFRDPTIISFKLEGNGLYNISISTNCDYSLPYNSIFLNGSKDINILINSCPTAGIYKVKLKIFNETDKAADTTYVLSEPTIIYEKTFGNDLHYEIDFISFIYDIPVKVRLWLRR